MAIARSTRTWGLCVPVLLALGCSSSKPAESPTSAPSEEAASAEPDLADTGEASAQGFGPGLDAISAGDFEKARGVFSGVVAEQPSNAKAHFYLGVAQQNLGQADVAVASYEKALALDPRLTEASVNLTAALLDAGEAGKAAPIIERALAREPSHPGLLYNRALAASMLGKTTEAVKAFREALAADPSNVEIKYGYAEALVAAGSGSEAKRLLVELSTSDDIAVLASSARLLGRLEDFDGCIKALDKALGREPSAELFVARGLCQHGKKNDVAALADFQKAIQKDPRYAPAHYYAGMDAKARGKKAEAKKALAKAAELGGDSGVGKAAQRALEGL
jgi:tetratricopeptide (TPR) repeat protein